MGWSCFGCALNRELLTVGEYVTWWSNIGWLRIYYSGKCRYVLCSGENPPPPFTKGKRQLSQLEVDTSRQLSAVRIHVERVIGVLRQKYSFLEGTCLWLLIMDRAWLRRLLVCVVLFAIVVSQLYLLTEKWIYLLINTSYVIVTTLYNQTSVNCTCSAA